MTFEQLQKHRDAQKIVLLELDLPFVNDFLIADDEGLWYKELTPDEIILAGYGVLNPDRNTDDFFDVNSVTVYYNDQVYNFTKTSSRSGCLAQNRSFYYFDSKVYIHFNDFDPPLGRVIKIGILSGFCNKYGSINKGRYNDRLYEDRLSSIPSISYKKDPTSFGVIEFQEVNYSLINQDGHFDDIQYGIRQVNRQEIRCLFGYDTLTRDDFQIIHKSIIGKFNKTRSKYTIKGIDFRQVLNKSLPENTYSTDDYANLDEDADGELIPLAYGVIKNAPCVEINTSTHIFKICDTTYHPIVSGSVTSYKDEVAVTSGITYDYVEGTFTLDTYDDEEITADFSIDTGTPTSPTGTILENPVDIMKDLIVNWGTFAFIDTNFNLTEWNTETTNNAGFKIGKYIDDEKKITDIISDLCKSSNINFIPQKDGLYTVRSYDPDRSISAVIQNWEWIDDPSEDNPQDYFLSSIVIKYGLDINNDEYKTYVNNMYKSEAIENYSIENTRTIEADLSDEASAITLSDEIMSIAKDIPPVIERTLDMYRFNLKIMDFIYACHDRDIASTDFKKYEIIGITFDLNKFQIKLKMREVEDVEFANNWLIWDMLPGWDDAVWL